MIGRIRVSMAGVSLLVLTVSGGCKTFVADKAFVNGGKPVEEAVTMEMSKSWIPLQLTETTLHWASGGGTVLDRKAASNPAIIYYGHKEKPKKAKKPQKIPYLVLAKFIKDGRHVDTVFEFDEPPPPTLIYRLAVLNCGSADYEGRLELVDQLPSDVTYVGIAGVHDRENIWLPYVGVVEEKDRVEGWQVEATTGSRGQRVRWWIDNVKLKDEHWITVDIEFEPPPFESTETD